MTPEHKELLQRMNRALYTAAMYSDGLLFDREAVTLGDILLAMDDALDAASELERLMSEDESHGVETSSTE